MNFGGGNKHSGHSSVSLYFLNFQKLNYTIKMTGIPNIAIIHSFSVNTCLLIPWQFYEDDNSKALYFNTEPFNQR